MSLLRRENKSVALGLSSGMLSCVETKTKKKNKKKNLPELSFIALVQKKEKRNSCLGGYKSTTRQ